MPLWITRFQVQANELTLPAGGEYIPTRDDRCTVRSVAVLGLTGERRWVDVLPEQFAGFSRHALNNLVIVDAVIEHNVVSGNHGRTVSATDRNLPNQRWPLIAPHRIQVRGLDRTGPMRPKQLRPIV